MPLLGNKTGPDNGNRESQWESSFLQSLEWYPLTPLSDCLGPRRAGETRSQGESDQGIGDRSGSDGIPVPDPKFPAAC